MHICMLTLHCFCHVAHAVLAVAQYDIVVERVSVYVLECACENLEKHVSGEILPVLWTCVVDLSFVFPCVSKFISHEVCGCNA